MKLYDKSNHSVYKTKDLVQKPSANAQDVAQSTYKNAGNIMQDPWARAKDTAQLASAQVEKRMKLGMDKTRAWLAVGIGIASTLLHKNKYTAQKKLETAQKNLQDMQGPLQRNVRSSLTKTVGALSDSTLKARESLNQATTRAKEMQELWQEQYIQRQRKRKRAKMIFRWGIVAGAVLALLYTPIAGSEVRQRLAKEWQQYRSTSV